MRKVTVLLAINDSLVSRNVRHHQTTSSVHDGVVEKIRGSIANALSTIRDKLLIVPLVKLNLTSFFVIVDLLMKNSHRQCTYNNDRTTQLFAERGRSQREQTS